MTLPIAEKPPGVLPAPAQLIIEHHHPWPWLQGIAAIRPEIRLLGFASSRIELGQRGFVGMQHEPSQQVDAQPIHQGLQRDADPSDPLGQGGAG